MPDKLVFLVAEHDNKLATDLANLLRVSFPGSVVYVASEGGEAQKKLRNVPTRLLVMGLDLGPKVSGMDLFHSIQADKAFNDMPVLVLSDLPDNEPSFVNDMQSGRLKFLSMPLNQDEFVSTVRKMLEMDKLKTNVFQTIILEPGQGLFKEGDAADRAFLVKSGKLEASRNVDGKLVILGNVLPGEFVGEMAHITGSPRIADVKAVEKTELIEILCGTLDLLIFSKPTWAKALLKTLCRRLREADLKHR